MSDLYPSFHTPQRSTEQNESSWEKFKAPPNMLEQEAKTNVMKLSELQEDSILMKEVEFFMKSADDEALRNAWAMKYTDISMNLLKQKLKTDVSQDFILWLVDRSGYNLPEFQYFERRPLTYLPGVKEFLDDPVDKRSEVIAALTKLKACGPKNLNEAWLYYKYIVRETGIDDYSCFELYWLNQYDYMMRVPKITAVGPDAKLRSFPDPRYKGEGDANNPAPPRAPENWGNYYHVWRKVLTRDFHGILETSEFKSLNDLDKHEVIQAMIDARDKAFTDNEIIALADNMDLSLDEDEKDTLRKNNREFRKFINKQNRKYDRGYGNAPAGAPAGARAVAGGEPIEQIHGLDGKLYDINDPRRVVYGNTSYSKTDIIPDEHNGYYLAGDPRIFIDDNHVAHLYPNQQPQVVNNIYNAPAAAAPGVAANAATQDDIIRVENVLGELNNKLDELKENLPADPTRKIQQVYIDLERYRLENATRDIINRYGRELNLEVLNNINTVEGKYMYAHDIMRQQMKEENEKLLNRMNAFYEEKYRNLTPEILEKKFENVADKLMKIQQNKVGEDNIRMVTEMAKLVTEIQNIHNQFNRIDTLEEAVKKFDATMNAKQNTSNDALAAELVRLKALLKKMKPEKNKVNQPQVVLPNDFAKASDITQLRENLNNFNNQVNFTVNNAIAREFETRIKEINENNQRKMTETTQSMENKLTLLQNNLVKQASKQIETIAKRHKVVVDRGQLQEDLRTIVATERYDRAAELGDVINNIERAIVGRVEAVKIDETIEKNINRVFVDNMIDKANLFSKKVEQPMEKLDKNFEKQVKMFEDFKKMMADWSGMKKDIEDTINKSKSTNEFMNNQKGSVNMDTSEVDKLKKKLKKMKKQKAEDYDEFILKITDLGVHMDNQTREANKLLDLLHKTRVEDVLKPQQFEKFFEKLVEKKLPKVDIDKFKIDTESLEVSMLNAYNNQTKDLVDALREAPIKQDEKITQLSDEMKKQVSFMMGIGTRVETSTRKIIENITEKFIKESRVDNTITKLHDTLQGMTDKLGKQILSEASITDMVKRTLQELPKIYTEADLEKIITNSLKDFHPEVVQPTVEPMEEMRTYNEKLETINTNINQFINTMTTELNKNSNTNVEFLRQVGKVFEGVDKTRESQIEDFKKITNEALFKIVEEERNTIGRLYSAQAENTQNLLNQQSMEVKKISEAQLKTIKTMNDVINNQTRVSEVQAAENSRLLEEMNKVLMDNQRDTMQNLSQLTDEIETIYYQQQDVLTITDKIKNSNKINNEATRNILSNQLQLLNQSLSNSGNQVMGELRQQAQNTQQIIGQLNNVSENIDKNNRVLLNTINEAAQSVRGRFESLEKNFDHAYEKLSAKTEQLGQVQIKAISSGLLNMTTNDIGRIAHEEIELIRKVYDTRLTFENEKLNNQVLMDYAKLVHENLDKLDNLARTENNQISVYQTYADRVNEKILSRLTDEMRQWVRNLQSMDTTTQMQELKAYAQSIIDTQSKIEGNLNKLDTLGKDVLDKSVVNAVINGPGSEIKDVKAHIQLLNEVRENEITVPQAQKKMTFAERRALLFPELVAKERLAAEERKLAETRARISQEELRRLVDLPEIDYSFLNKRTFTPPPPNKRRFAAV